MRTYGADGRQTAHAEWMAALNKGFAGAAHLRLQAAVAAEAAEVALADTARRGGEDVAAAAGARGPQQRRRGGVRRHRGAALRGRRARPGRRQRVTAVMSNADYQRMILG